MSTDDKKPGVFSRLFGRSKPTSAPEPRPTSDIVPEEAVEAIAEPPPVHVPDDLPVPVENVAPPSIEPEPSPVSPPAEPEPPAASGGSWFQRLKSGLSKTSSQLTSGITNVFTKRKLDAATIDDLEDILIQADLGVAMATRITDKISDGRFAKGVSADEVRAILANEVEAVLTPVAKPLDVNRGKQPHVILMIGVNGAGKTTTIGKLASQFQAQGKSVLVAAGDTFRAAAVDQLKVWAERTGAGFISRDIGADAAGLAFDALTEAKTNGTDIVLIDTAGRLQNKEGLMDELEKVVRVMKKVDPEAPHDVLLVLDATTGQNALRQVEVFRERAGVTGIVMTKLDGTARGGILVAIAQAHGLPVHAIGVGEGVGDLAAFDAGEFAAAIAAD
ncbi:MAG: fused signal recognition particle receptor [Alphaproteobacteria bacterium]